MVYEGGGTKQEITEITKITKITVSGVGLACAIDFTRILLGKYNFLGLPRPSSGNGIAEP